MTTSTGTDALREHQLPALAPDAILLHIGPHKTGTTAIQSVLASSRKALAEHGVQYPGKLTAHHREAKALRQFRDGWEDAGPPPEPEVWSKLARTARDNPGRVVISSEFFAEADAAARARLVEDLGVDRIHLLIAGRNPAGIAVSTWQQVVRTFGRSASLEEWLEHSFRRVEGDPPTRFWKRADPAALLRQWSDVVPIEQMSVVVLDEQDRRRLPETLEQLLGLPAGLLADQQPKQSNRGLSAAEAALIRRINAAIEPKLSWAEYSRMMRRGVIQRLLRVRRPGPDEAKDRLPTWAAEQAVVEAERSIAGLRSSGVRIVGDPEALRSLPDLGGETEPITSVPIELATEAVVGAIAVATRGQWSLDRPRRRAGTPPAAQAARQADLANVPTREIVHALVGRVRTRIGRRRRSA